MAGFPAIDVAIGLIFVYFLLSVACSAFSELLASLANLRGSQLRKGIMNVLTQVMTKDETGKEQAAPEGKPTSTLAEQVLSHPLIETLGTQKWMSSKLKFPSYIPSRAFSLALLDSIVSKGSGPSGNTSVSEDAKEPGKELMNKLRQGAEKYPNLGVGKILTVFAEEVGNDVEKLRERIDTWFDQAMARVSGAYKRRAQLIVLILSLLVVVGANADTLKIAKTLSADPALRQALSSQAQAVVQQQGEVSGEQSNDELDKSLKQLQDLQVLGVPLGWKEWPQDWTGWDWLNKCVGLVLTILAVSLGAPFWFDLLGKIVNIKGAGTLPQRASGGQAARATEKQGAATQ